MGAKAPGTTELVLSQVLRWPTPRSRDWTARFVQSAASDPNVVAVVGVGSAVRPGVGSADLDLVVICRDPAILDRAHPLEVDLRAYPSATVDAEIERGHDILGWAIKFGQALYQADYFWDRKTRFWRERLPLPSPELARSRAMFAYRFLADMIKIGDVDGAKEQALSYLTHLARAELLEKGIYPASRPELADQLRMAGDPKLAKSLKRLQQDGLNDLSQINRLTNFPLHPTGL